MISNFRFGSTRKREQRHNITGTAICRFPSISFYVPVSNNQIWTTYIWQLKYGRLNCVVLNDIPKPVHQVPVSRSLID